MSETRELLFSIVEARGITSAGEGREPVVFATVVRSEESSPILRTTAIPGTRDPRWNETLHMIIGKNENSSPTDVTVQVIRRNCASAGSIEESVLGSCRVPIPLFGKPVSRDNWYPLVPPNSSSPSGAVRISLELIDCDPLSQLSGKRQPSSKMRPGIAGTPLGSREVRSVFCIGPDEENLCREMDEYVSSHTVKNITNISFPATITNVFPPNMEKDIPHAVWLFCMPDGFSLARSRLPPTVFSFAIPGQDSSEQRYITCLVHYEPLPLPSTRSLSRSFTAAVHRNSSSVSSNLVLTDLKTQSAATEPSSPASPTAPERSVDDDVAKALYFPRCVCIETRAPHFQFAREWLLCLYERAIREHAPHVAEYMIAHLLWCVPAATGTRSVHIPVKSSSSKHPVTINDIPCFAMRRFRATDLPMETILRWIPAKNLAFLVQALLIESRVVLVCNDKTLLAHTTECLLALLYPLQWCGIYLPVLPARLAHYLNIQTPYLIGLTRRTFVSAGAQEAILQSSTAPTVVYDIDNACVTASQSISDNLLPKEALDSLIKDLQYVYNDQQHPDSCDWDPWAPVERVSPVDFALGVRTAFLRTMDVLLTGHRKHLLFLRTAPSLRALFNIERAVDEKAQDDRAFFSAFFRTRHFLHFVGSNTVPSYNLFSSIYVNHVSKLSFAAALAIVQEKIKEFTLPPVKTCPCQIPPEKPKEKEEEGRGKHPHHIWQLEWKDIEAAAAELIKDGTPEFSESSNKATLHSPSLSSSKDAIKSILDKLEEECLSIGTAHDALFPTVGTQRERALAQWFICFLADDRHAMTTAEDMELLQHVANLVLTRTGRKVFLGKFVEYKSVNRIGVVLSPQYFTLVCDVVRSAMSAAFKERDFLTAVGFASFAQFYAKFVDKKEPEKKETIFSHLITLDIWNSSLFWEAKFFLDLDTALQQHNENGTLASSIYANSRLSEEDTKLANDEQQQFVNALARIKCSQMLEMDVSDVVVERWINTMSDAVDLDMEQQRQLRGLVSARVDSRTGALHSLPDATSFESLTSESRSNAPSGSAPTYFLRVWDGRNDDDCKSGRALMNSILCSLNKDLPQEIECLSRLTNMQGTSETKVHNSRYTRSRIVEKVLTAKSGDKAIPPVLCLTAFNDHVACGTTEGVVNVWSTKDCSLKASLSGHRDWVTNLVYCPGFLVSSSLDKTATVWDSTQMQKVRTLRAHQGPITCLASAHEGTIVATAGADKAVFVWDLRSKSPVFKLGDIAKAATALAINRDLYVMVGARDNNVYYWDLQKPSTTCICSGHRDWVSCVLFAGDATRFVPMSAALDGEIITWDWDHNQVKRRLSAHNGAITQLQFTQSSCFITAGADTSLKLWELSPFHQRRNLLGHTDAISSLLQFHNLVVTGSRDCGIRLWDIGIEPKKTSDKMSAYTIVDTLGLKPRATSGAAGIPPCLQQLDSHTGPVSALCNVSDYSFASASWDGTVRLWEFGNEY